MQAYINNECFPEMIKKFFIKAFLTHYRRVLLFYTPWKHQKTQRFSDVFRWYRKATPGCNGLNKTSGQLLLSPAYKSTPKARHKDNGTRCLMESSFGNHFELLYNYIGYTKQIMLHQHTWRTTRWWSWW